MPQSLIGSFVLVDDVARVHAAERDLGRRDEIQIRSGDAIDLRLGSARDETRAVQNIIACQVRRDDRRVPGLGQQTHRVMLQRQFQEDAIALEVVKPRPGDLGPRGKIDQTQVLAQLHVVQRRKVELPRLMLAVLDFEVRLVIDADGRCGVGHVRNGAQDGIRSARRVRSSPWSRRRSCRGFADLLLCASRVRPGL